jgi:hypothetical protein
MKKIAIVTILCIASFSVFSQTSEVSNVKALSAQIFKWEVARLNDSLSSVFHSKLQVWGTSGAPINKAEYLQRLKSPDFIHNNVTVENSTALIVDNTAIVNGDGIFELTISGNKTTLHLSYTEVFTRINTSKPWLLLAINAKQKTN